MELKLPEMIDGAQAWYGSEMSSTDEWIHTASKNEVKEISEALVLAENKDIASLTSKDFPLPKLGERLRLISDEVIHGRGFALLRGLPVDRWSIKQAATAYFGIGTHLGSARSQNGKGHVLGHVRDLGRDAVNDTNARIYQTRERQLFHTDSCDMVALLCLKAAKAGGASALVSSMTIYNEMYKRRPDLLRLLFEPFATDRRGEIPEGKKPFFEIPVFNFYKGYLSVIYARRYINSAQRFDGVPVIKGQRLEALDLFDSLANDRKLNLEMNFQPGDIQFVHNHTMLHDRTDYVDWEEEEKKRHLLRLWLAIPGARPLPEIFKERYGTIEIGDRGGIIVPGSELNAPLTPV
ncbi:MAG: taurine catabolism dioxygenase TauD [Rhodospirillaceae bacterium]|nr:taurine catabolism dioxygenase TauD [Rhodospirillaceae bacterium]|tara:strand:+ start:3134 stop:4183 length:1050 start_codon:yes stop_codon:yes gene_type:complete